MSSLTADGTSLVPAAGNPANGGAVVAPAPVFDGPNLPVQDGPNKPPAPVAPVTPVAPVVKAPAPTAPTTPVTPTAGQIYNNNGSVDDTTLDDTGISGGQNETSQNDMSDAETRAQTIARFQSQIDATNAIYADELAKAQVAGKNMIGEQTASNGRAGLSGSSFGNASIGGVEDKNQQNYAAVEAAKQAAIATIMDGANKQADTDVAAKNTAYNAGLDETLKYQNDKDTRTATNTSTAAKTFLDQGIDPNTIDPALQKSLATKYGVSFGSIVDSYNTQKASAAAASAAAAQKAEFKLGAGETQFDANGNPIATVAPKESAADAAAASGALTTQQATVINNANTQLQSNPDVKAFQQTATAYANIQNIPTNTTDPVQDFALTTSIAHLIAPGSTSLRGALNALKPEDLQSGAWNTLNKIEKEFAKKGDISPENVASLKTLATQMYQTQQEQYSNTRNAVVQTAVNRGIANADDLITNYAGSSTTQGQPSVADRAVVAKAFSNAPTTGAGSYDDFTDPSNVPQGQIPVINNQTGVPGYIPQSEFDPSQYTMA